MSVFDGHAGWLMFPNKPLREMHDADLAAARIDADLHFALHIQQMFPDLRVQYSEKVAGRDAYVLLGTQSGQPPTQFCFDKQSGLLVRMVRHADSPLGLNPSQVDYADYRAVDGVEVPFRVTVSEPGSSWTIQVEQVQQNVAIDDARFVKPVQR